MNLIKCIVAVGICILYGYSISHALAHSEDVNLSECSYLYEPLTDFREITDYCDFGYEYQPAYVNSAGQAYYQFPYYNGGSADFGPEYTTYNYGRGSEYYQDSRK
jgi:hypothetical protein